MDASDDDLEEDDLNLNLDLGLLDDEDKKDGPTMIGDNSDSYDDNEEPMVIDDKDADDNDNSFDDGGFDYDDFDFDDDGGDMY